MEKNNTLYLLAATFTLALVLRCVYIHQQSVSNPFFYYLIMDESVHDQWAAEVASGGYQGGVYFRPPLYYYLLGAFYYLFGRDLYLARIYQAFLSSISCVLLYWLGKKLFDTRAGLIAAFIMAVYWPSIYFSGELLITTLYVLLVLSLILSLIYARENKSKKLWLLAGLLLGFSAIARMNVLLFYPAIILWLYLENGREKILKTIESAAILFVGLSIIVLPVTARNYTIGNDFVLIASQSGVNFYIGNNPASDGISAVVPGTRADWWGGYNDTIRIAERNMGRKLAPSEISNYWYRRATTFIIEKPKTAIQLSLKKLCMFWQMREESNNKSIHFFKNYSSLMKLPLISWGLMAPLGLFGILLTITRKGGIRLPISYMLVHMLTVVAFFVNARFRIPVAPLMMLYAAYALTWLAQKIREKERRQIKKAVIALAAIYLFVNASARGYGEYIHKESAQARYSLGIYYKNQGMLDKAEEEYIKSIEIEPELFYSHHNLGNLYVRQGRIDEGIEELKKAVELEPSFTRSYLNLGNAYMTKGDTRAAEEQYLLALIRDLKNAQAHFNLGYLYTSMGEYDKAEREYKLTLRLSPEDGWAHNNLGNIYYLTGRVAEAIPEYEMAVELDPDNTIARNNLKIARAKLNFDAANRL